MHTLRRHLSRWTWIALVAVLGAALAPTLSHALAAAAPDHPWTEICSSAPAPGTPPSPAWAEHGHAEHCALCVQLGAAPLPSMVPTARVVSAVIRLCGPEAAAPFARLPWRSAQPRGPPAFA